MDSDLGGQDGFMELTNIECNTLSGSPSHPQFLILGLTENDFFQDVRFSKRC